MMCTRAWAPLFSAVLVAASASAQPAPAPAAAQPAPPAPGQAAASEAVGVERPLPAGADAPLRVVEPERGGLTAEEVARRSVASSATIRARRAELDATVARIRQTAMEYFPRVTLRAQYTRLSPVAADFGSGALVGAANAGPLSVGVCPPPLVGTCVLDSAGQPVGAASFQIESLQDNYSLNANVTVPLSDYVFRLPDSAAAAKASRQAGQLNIRAERRKVQSEARLLYYGWVGAVGQVTVAEKSLERTRARLKDAEAAFSLGAISKADLMRLEALVANTELAVKEAQTLRDLRARQLGIVMGEPDRTALREIGEDVMAPASARVTGNLEGLTSEALKNRIELAALGQSSQALRRGADAVRARGYPRLDAFGDLTYANPNQRYFPPAQEWNATWSVGVAATWTINDTFGMSAAGAELEANARALEAQRAVLVDGIRQEVAAAYLDREKALVAIETSSRAARAAAEAYRVATDLYQVGRATTTELIEAEADLLNARLTELSAHVGLRAAEERLRFALGR